MGRKVFMSVLGTSLYNECSYYLKDKANSVKSRFVQEATIKMLCSDWKKEDQIIIFTTSQSFVDNYKADIEKRFDRNTNQQVPYIGLQKLLDDLDLLTPIKNVQIKDGNSETEIWNIFETIYGELEEDDEIFFDITHSFRYLPMLLMILFNYSEFLKRTKIKSITYGNYEISKQFDNYAPVMDLMPLILLKDWSNAVNNFEHFGEVKQISNLCQESLRPILKEAKGTDAIAKSINSFSKDLPKFVKNIQTCRGNEIIGGSLAKSLMERIENIQETTLAPFNPIFTRLKIQVNKFSNPKNIKNGLAAVDWCIQNGLIQQGLTLLQETLISLVCESENLDFTVEEFRNIVSNAFNIKEKCLPESEWIGDCTKTVGNKKITHKVLENNVLNLLAKEYKTLTSLRNDINHAGMKKDSAGFDKFEKQLCELYCKIQNKIIP